MSDAAGASVPTSTTNTTTTIPDYARPYVEEMLGGTSALTFARDDSGNITGFQPYQTYGGDRTAQFSPLQQQSYEGAGALGAAPQLYAASDMANRAGLAALSLPAMGPAGATNAYTAPGAYTPSQVSNQYAGAAPFTAGTFQNQFDGTGANGQPVGNYQGGTFNAMMTGTGRFIDPTNAADYMSPYMEGVVEVQQRDAQRQADIASAKQQAMTTQAGAFGGSRDAIIRAEAARNLALQKGDITATGLQAAYQQAQQQFNADQQRSLQSQIANQGANLQAQQMGEQSRQYGANLGLQGALAKAQYGQAAQALGEQSRQFGSQQSMQNAQNMANFGQAAQALGVQDKQFGYSQAAQNAGLDAQYGQAAQQLNEQSRQFGAGLGLQALQTAMTGANTLGTLGGQQYTQDRGAVETQNTLGLQQQQQMQNILNQQYQDFLNQQRYPYQQMGYMSDMLRGLPMSNSTTQMYGQQASPLSSLAGLATTAYGVSKMARGGQVKRRGGLQEMALARMMEAA